MGKLFLMAWCLGWGPLGLAKGDPSILPLDMPAMAPLPVAQPQDLQQDLERLQKKHQKENPLPLPPPSRQKEALAAETVKQRPYRAVLQAGLVIPTVWTKLPRNRYTTELTSHIWGAMRVTGADAQGWHLWVGARVAPFSGTGMVENTPGRYGVLYWGPVFALGKINPVEEAATQDRSHIRIEGTVQRQAVSRSGWMWLGGVAVQSSIGDVEPASETIEKELQTKGGNLEATAIWLECMYARIYYGTIGVHPSVGVQYGKGLSFAWVSLAFGGWY